MNAPSSTNLMLLPLVALIVANCNSEPTSEVSDRDGDGVADSDDAFPDDPSETTDTDGDGIGDNKDVFPEMQGCPAGYQQAGAECVDVDECAESLANCHADASCTNTEGSFECACDAGFEGTGEACNDIDECSDATDNCDVNASCDNNDGGFACACNEGFNGDGTMCVDTGDCVASPCIAGGDAGATCTEGTTGYTCSCTTGYDDDGTTCSELDECVGNPCDDAGDNISVCTDVSAPGTGYACACGSGFDSDGTTCVGSVAAMSFFVSSTSPSANANGNLGGLAGADAHCVALAQAVNAVRTQWVAYLSTEGDPNNAGDDVNAIDRIGTGPWYNADEVLFAPNLDAIHTIQPNIIACDPGPATCLQDRADYILIKPADELFLDETGVQITDPLQGGGRGHDIFTGSNPDGTVFAGNTCGDWTSNSGNDTARVGHTDVPSNTQFSPSWNSGHDTSSCSTSGVASRGGAGFIYCFATD